MGRLNLWRQYALASSPATALEPELGYEDVLGSQVRHSAGVVAVVWLELERRLVGI